MFRIGLILTLSLSLINPLFAVEPGKGDDKTAPQLKSKEAFAQKIEELLAMPAKERKAYLKSIKPSERRGLWYQMKKEQTARKGLTVKKADYGPGYAIGVTPGEEWANRGTLGSIIYDAGFPDTAFAGGAIIGNRFNTHTAIPVLASGSVTAIQALVIPGPANTTSSAGFVLEGPQTTMGGALAIFSTFGTASGLIDSLSFTGLGVNYTGSSFFVLFGDFSSVYIPVFGGGTTNGQGHHGVVGITGGMGPNITATSPLTGLNSFIRASGNIVPVELMKFEVE
jgi:hypothetical protein